MKISTTILGLTALLFSQLSVANTLVLPSFFEPSLIGIGGILDDEFGLGNLQRIDDDMDQYWTVTGEISATAVAKHAGYRQNFGILDNANNFTSLLYVPYMNGQTGSSTVPVVGDQIRFGLTRGAYPSHGNKPIFSSDPSDNVICAWIFCSSPKDHMVSWLITDGQYAGDYVLAWEDLKFLDDRDYNDLVVRISGVSTISAVPVPAAAWLFGSGLLGLAAVARRRV